MISITLIFFKHIKIARFAGGPCIMLSVYFRRVDFRVLPSNKLRTSGTMIPASMLD